MNMPLYFHIDVNSAYLSWTAVRELKNGNAQDLRLIASAIGGDQEKRHGIILAKSPLARACGIRTGEPVASAVKKCPNLKLVPPDFELYDTNSRAFLDILKRYSPLVEPFSIDEAFMDMTGTGLLYDSPVSAAESIRQTIKEELGFTVNIGISENRLLAKMASDFEKPDKVHTLFPEEIAEKMWPLDIRELYMVGRSAEATLRKLGIHTIGDLAASNPATIKAHLKKHGETLFRYAHGLDDGQMLSPASKDKEVGNSTTLPHDVESADEAKNILLSLCETVCTRLRHDGLRASCVSVRITDCEFVSHTHQRILPVTTNVTGEVFSVVTSLFSEMWDGTPIRLLGVQASHITEASYRQYNLFDSGKIDKMEKLDSAIDEIRKKFGEDSIRRASFLNSETNHMTGRLSKNKRRITSIPQELR
ncbi:DNA polymerase IV [Lacrimispora sp. NSJ-141]|uniref:DNA polymerase IV n=1 Tax=Lientehia hominis TaxID=2897778 RepID=A0AAP2RFH2_9FIRM|nr:DNA polymerase IV [Lientehia hominis]MCD2491267.1 DNA polymerase IV [Lientehia hominis]